VRLHFIRVENFGYAIEANQPLFRSSHSSLLRI
jgi:hypothetical protein